MTRQTEKRPALIIPMAGLGRRFVEAGIEGYKPFVPVHGAPMVGHVAAHFPPPDMTGGVERIVIAVEDYLEDVHKEFLVNRLGATIIYVEPHSDGPAGSLARAAPKLLERDLSLFDRPLFVAYCDIDWLWDWQEARALMADPSVDGAIFVHNGFHPHLYKDNLSAFCRPEPSDPGICAEIKEKGSFTLDWVEEPVSIGVFYVRRGGDLLTACVNLANEESRRVAGEFYPSVAMNDLILKGARIALSPVPWYVHWGVPEQLLDFDRWEAIERSVDEAVMARSRWPRVVCMGGKGSRMIGVSDKPKPLIPIRGQPMFDFIVDKFPAGRTLLICGREMQDILGPSLPHDVLPVPSDTKSQLETLQWAQRALVEEGPFFLLSCDCYGLFDAFAFEEFLAWQKPDAVIFSFEPSLLQKRLQGAHSHISFSDDRVIDVHIKGREGPRDRGLAGFFWFNGGSYFRLLDHIPPDAEHEMGADHLLKHMVDTGHKVLHYPLDAYVHLGTPEELREFLFWCRRPSVFRPASLTPARFDGEVA
jgi:NDP-sugar pyrophosphorylase family protein